MPETGDVGLVLAEKGLGRPVTDEGGGAQNVVVAGDGGAGPAPHQEGTDRTRVIDTPGPHIPEPQGRQQRQRGFLRPGVAGCHPDAHVVGSGLGVIDGDLPVAVVVEHAGVEELVLGVVLGAGGIAGEQIAVGVFHLGIQIAPAHPGMGGRGVQVEPVLLHVLAVASLVAGETERSLLEDRVTAVPERKGQA